MFGGNRKKKESLSEVMSPENAPGKSKSGAGFSGFDPEGLERAAKAARDLDNSRNASHNRKICPKIHKLSMRPHLENFRFHAQSTNPIHRIFSMF